MSSPRFAKKTDVPVERTKAQLEKLVTDYGATSFGTAWNDKGEAFIQFTLAGRALRFTMPPLEVLAKEATTIKQREQIHRSAWRGLHLLVKAKLEATRSGYTVFEEEFLGHIVTETGQTVAQRLLPKLPPPDVNGRLQLPAEF